MRTRIQATLEDVLGAGLLRLVEGDEARSWSRTFTASLSSGTRVFVKGTPRKQGEGTITAHLAMRCPDIVPSVLHDDLLPEDDWQWFVLEDAGDCGRIEVTSELACRAAFALGLLQRTVAHDTFLAARLPSCRPEQLAAVSLTSCATLERHADSLTRERARQLGAQLRRLEPALQRAVALLATVPLTCVHGDFWPGNIALRGDTLRLIDWGEAVWGVGAASIWNLLLSSRSTLAGAEAAVWQAYSEGLQQPLDAGYRWAARIAFFVTMLAVNQHLHMAAEAANAPETLELLEQIIGAVEKDEAMPLRT